MTPQQQQVQNLKNFLKTAKTRGGFGFSATAIQKDAFGNPTTITGTVNILNEKDETVATACIWDTTGRAQMTTPLVFDLITEELITSDSEVDAPTVENGADEGSQPAEGGNPQG